jgi:DNA-binding NarL/FixJ family response regulator
LRKGVPGTQTAQIILQNHDIPILFLSSHTDPAIVARTEKITAYGYVVKQSGITVLDASIKMAFKLHAAHQQLVAQNQEIEAVNQTLRRERDRLAAVRAGVGPE